jgi:hypothetical protein
MTMRSERPGGEATTDPGNKSAAEIEREVRQQRADVERNLDALQDRLSPGQLVDQAMNYVRQGGGGEFFRNLGDSVKHNPVPVALIGVGVAWMMASSGRRNGHPERDYWIEDEFEEYDELHELDEYEGGAYAATDYPYDAATRTATSGSYGAGSGTASSGLEGATTGARTDPLTGAASTSSDEHGPSMSDRAKATAAGAREKADELRRRAREAAGSARAGVGQMGSRARAGLDRAGRGFSGGADRTRAYASQYGRRARQGFLHTLNEQPLVLGAIGLAVGAVLGSALPSTSREDRMMGGARDRLKHRAAEEGREQMHKAQAAAGAAYEAARDEADRQGLTPEGGKRAMEAGREKLERVAEAAQTAAKEESERQGLGKAGTSAGSGTSTAGTGTGGTSTSGSGTSTGTTGTGPRTEAERHGVSKPGTGSSTRS